MRFEEAKDVMTKKILTVRIDDPIEKAQRLMELRKIRHLPVVDRLGGLVGILSDRDLLRAASPEGQRAALAVADRKPSFGPELLAKDFMSWPVRCVLESEPLRSVAEKMLAEKISAVVVVGADNHARGIVTTDDLLRVLITMLNDDPSSVALKLGSSFEALRAHA